MGLLLSTRRALITDSAWTPASPTGGGYSPDHWYRSDSGLWQDAGVTPAASDGDVVGRWEDKTANADHVNQANAGNKPTLQSGAADLLNGHAVIRCDGIDDYLQGAFTNGGQMTQPNTIFAIGNMTVDAVAGRTLLDGDRAAGNHRMGSQGNSWQLQAGTALNGGADGTGWNIWTAVVNGAASQLWLNGVSNAGPGDAGAEHMLGLTVGTHDAFGWPWVGDIAEIILYDANLSDSDKNQVAQYLAARYNLTYTSI